MSEWNRRHLKPTGRPLINLVLLGCATVFVARLQPCYAQGGRGATINGTVTDQSGAVVPGAKVSITNVTTGQTRDVVTASDGGYTAPFLPVGQYSITVTCAGFKSKTQTGITLTTDEVATVNIALELGEVWQKIEVTAGAEMVETTTAALGQVVNSTSVVELPLNGRNPAALAFLVPGGTDGSRLGITLAGQGSGMPTEMAASINSSRMGGVYYTLDGVYNVDNYLQSANPFPNPDATQEFRVLTNNFDAQYGFASNAVVSVVTKSGTNNWHGDAFEFVRNDTFDAADFFSHKTDGLKQNQFGGSVGGPIKKDKDLIFGNLQFTQERSAPTSSAAQVPTNAMLNGDFSYLNSAGVQLHNYAGVPFLKNQIPTSDFSPVALNIEKHLPTSSNPSGLVYITGLPVVEDFREFTIKDDFFASPKSHIMGRVYFQNFNEPAASGSNWLATHDSWQARNTNIAGTWTYSAAPSFVNNLNFGYDRLNSSALSGINQGWKDVGANIATPDPNITVLVNWGSPVGFSWFEQNIIQKRHDFDIADTVSWTKAKHLVVAGVNVLSSYSLEQASWLADPLVIFNGSVTGSWYSDFLLGDPSTFEQGGGEFNKYAGIQWAGFAQDTIRLKPNLTLNVGVRYEPWFPPHPIPSTRIAGFKSGQQSTVYPNAPAGLVYPGDAGVPFGGYPSEPGNFSPRLGIAWQPKFLHNTSIRAAFGRFLLPYAYTYLNHVGADAPFSPTFALNPATVAPKELSISAPWANFTPTGGTSPVPPFALSGYVPPSSVQFVLPTSIGAAFPTNFKLPWQQSWNFSVQHQFTPNLLLTVAYVGSEAEHIAAGRDLNPGICGPVVNGACSLGGKRLYYPNYSSMYVYGADGTASYNGLQLSMEKRFSHGFQFVSNYAWSKTLDEHSQSDLSSGGFLSDPYDIRFDKGLSNFNQPYLWSNTLVWRTPDLKARGALLNFGLGNWEVLWSNTLVWRTPDLKARGALLNFGLGNWEVSAIWTMTAGVPFSVVGGNGSNNSESLQYNDRADLTGQPFQVHQGSEGQWLLHYFNPAAFKVNAPGTFGNSARNLLRGPAKDNLDFMLAKNFPFKERYRVQFRWEMFNATNTPVFGTPIADPSQPSDGQITSTAGPPRIMQFAFKMYW